MKQILLIAGISFSLLSFTFIAAGDEVVSALKQADVAGFCNYLDTVIDLKLPQKDEIKNFGQAGASAAIKSFFEQNKVKGFELVSQREMGGIMYIAGKIKGTIKNYNITVMIKNNNTKPVILTVRIS
jgi:hypothetical protein